MIKYRYKNAPLLFVGINPHPGSFDRSVPFSNNKTFWYLLSRAGLLEEPIAELRDDARLQAMYRNKFTALYHLGFINIIDRPTKDVTLLLKGEEAPGCARVKKIIEAHKPKVACFIGKITYEKYSGLKKFDFGWQTNIASTRVYVMHFPLRGEARVRVRELKEVAKVAGLRA